jgi:hypothetical protein
MGKIKHNLENHKSILYIYLTLGLSKENKMKDSIDLPLHFWLGYIFGNKYIKSNSIRKFNNVEIWKDQN